VPESISDSIRGAQFFGIVSRDLIDCSMRVAHMLQTKMAPSSAVLRPYVWAYGMTTRQVDSVPLVIPLPARPKQLLTFFFGDTYRIPRPGSDTIILGVTSLLHDGAVRARPGAFCPAAVQVSHLQPKEN
jgi:hypothetical protein